MIFFSNWIFFLPQTPLDHFHPLHRLLDILQKQKKKLVASSLFQVVSFKKEDLIQCNICNYSLNQTTYITFTIHSLHTNLPKS